jgi:hypothetical protein
VRWVHLYILRAVGGFLKSGNEWLSKQLDLSNEIIKSCKKSVSEFAAARFLIPLFHIALYEPFEKVRLNLEEKHGVQIKLVFSENPPNKLDNIAILKEGKLVDRMFPKPNAATSQLVIEPPHEEFGLSEEFKRRKIPETLSECVSQMLLTTRGLLKDCHSRQPSTVTSLEKSSSASQKSTQSFTKFLSSSFSSLHFGGGPSSSEWIDKIDQLLVTPSPASNNTNILSRYVDLISAPPVALSPGGTVGKVDEKSQSKIAPVSLPCPPGFQAPPSAPVQPQQSARPLPTDEPAISSRENESIIAWRGEIIGPKHFYRINISLIPTFRSPADYLQMKKVLSDHAAWTFEGSLSVAKFADHFNKLMHPTHRAKREPYGFLACSPSDKQEAFLEHIGVNTAHAFAIIVAPYKVKLWILNVDASAPFHPLPLTEGLVFAFMEMPFAVFQPPEPLENIFTLEEILETVQEIKLNPSLVDPLVERRKPVVATIPEIYHAPVPPEVKRPRIEVPPSPPPPSSMPSAFFSRPLVKTSAPMPGGFVIGAPSTGPALDQLPNVQKGLCRFFNTVQGCQSASRCRYVHKCSLCGNDAHSAVFHEAVPRPSFYPTPGYPPAHPQFRH